MIGVEYGCWEIEIGVIYVVCCYQVIFVVYISGNLWEGYSGVGLIDFEFNIVFVLLNLCYNFVLYDKW